MAASPSTTTTENLDDGVPGASVRATVAAVCGFLTAGISRRLVDLVLDDIGVTEASIVAVGVTGLFGLVVGAVAGLQALTRGLGALRVLLRMMAVGAGIAAFTAAAYPTLFHAIAAAVWPDLQASSSLPGWSLCVVVAPWTLPVGAWSGAVAMGLSALAAPSTTARTRVAIAATCGIGMGVVVDHGAIALGAHRTPTLLVAATLATLCAAMLSRAAGRNPPPARSPPPDTPEAGRSGGGFVLMFCAAAPAGAFAAIAAHLTDATLGASATAHAVALVAGLAGAAVGVLLAAWRARTTRVDRDLAPAFAVAALAVSLAAGGWDKTPALLTSGTPPTSLLTAELWRLVIATALLAPAVAALAALPALIVFGHDKHKRDPVSQARATATHVGAAALGGAGTAILTITGFLDVVGSRVTLTLLTLALLALASLLAFLRRREPQSEPAGVWAASVTLATLAVLLPAWNPETLVAHDPTTLRATPLARRTHVVATAENVTTGLVTTTRQKPGKKARAQGARTLITQRHDGVVVDDDGPRVRAAARHALVSLQLTGGRTRAFVAGPAPEPLSRALHAGGMADIDVVRPAPLPPTVRVSEKRVPPGLHVFVDDARLALTRTRDRYDVVIVWTPPLGHARTARLVDPALFATAARRLTDGGVVAVGFPLAGASADLVLDVAGAARTAFSAVAVYVVGDHGLVVGGDHLEQRGEDDGRSTPPPAALAALLGDGDDPTAWVLLTVGDVTRALAARANDDGDDDGTSFALHAAQTSWSPKSPRRIVSALLGRLPTDVAATRRSRLDASFPPRAHGPQTTKKTTQTKTP